MKRIVFILGVSIFVSSLSVAQKSTKEFGPTVKNQKIWEKKKSSVLVTSKKDRKTGGAAKNAKLWENKSKETSSVVFGTGTKQNKKLAEKRVNQTKK